MIRQARASDEPAIRDCAEQAYARTVPLIGRKPAPMVADFAAQIAAGRGIGKALIAFCENAARRRGLNAVRLYTNETMTDNLSIYPKLGFVDTARRTEAGFNRVYFEKPLA